MPDFLYEGFVGLLVGVVLVFIIALPKLISAYFRGDFKEDKKDEE